MLLWYPMEAKQNNSVKKKEKSLILNLIYLVSFYVDKIGVILTTLVFTFDKLEHTVLRKA